MGIQLLVVSFSLTGVLVTKWFVGMVLLWGNCETWFHFNYGSIRDYSSIWEWKTISSIRNLGTMVRCENLVPGYDVGNAPHIRSWQKRGTLTTTVPTNSGASTLRANCLGTWPLWCSHKMRSSSRSVTRYGRQTKQCSDCICSNIHKHLHCDVIMGISTSFPCTCHVTELAWQQWILLMNLLLQKMLLNTNVCMWFWTTIIINVTTDLKFFSKLDKMIHSSLMS